MSPLRSPAHPQLGKVTLVPVEQPGGNRSMALRLVPWLIPIGLILLGLVFVAAGLDGSSKPATGDRAPATVRAVFVANAPAWAAEQAGAGVTTQIVDIVMVDAAAADTIFTSRAVIVRVDTSVLPAGDPAVTLSAADVSTVATCVVWDVDVATGTYVPKEAGEIRRQTGRLEITDNGELIRDCEAHSFPG